MQRIERVFKSRTARTIIAAIVGILAVLFAARLVMSYQLSKSSDTQTTQTTQPEDPNRNRAFHTVRMPTVIGETVFDAMLAFGYPENNTSPDPTLVPMPEGQNPSVVTLPRDQLTVTAACFRSSDATLFLGVIPTSDATPQFQDAKRKERAQYESGGNERFFLEQATGCDKTSFDVKVWGLSNG